jgi:hypothetical protein
LLHLTAGDVNTDRLLEAALPGRVVACIDVLHEGPAPGGVEGAAWRELRAGYAAARGWATRDSALARLAEADDAVDAARREDEIVLGFEHDLIFFGYLDGLIDGADPLVAAEGEVVRLTRAGRDGLAGGTDAIDARGVDRWLGGVHVESPPAPNRRPVWRWNAPAARVDVA